MIKIIDHDLLLCKRECYDGLVDNELPWFKNYLKSRKQVVCCNGSTLNPKDVQIGVLQGNVLGLILFLKNYIVQSVNDVFYNFFADDVILYAITSEICKVNEELEQTMTSSSGIEYFDKV